MSEDGPCFPLAGTVSQYKEKSGLNVSGFSQRQVAEKSGVFKHQAVLGFGQGMPKYYDLDL